MGHLVLSGIQGDLSLDPSKAGSGWIRLAEDQVSIAHIQLNGTSEVQHLYSAPLSHGHACRVLAGCVYVFALVPV